MRTSKRPNTLARVAALAFMAFAAAAAAADGAGRVSGTAPAPPQPVALADPGAMLAALEPDRARGPGFDVGPIAVDTASGPTRWRLRAFGTDRSTAGFAVAPVAGTQVIGTRLSLVFGVALTRRW